MRRRVSPALRLALTQYADRLRPLFGDRLLELRLFGSYGRGEAHEDSDVDVLVLIRGLTDLEVGVVAGEAAPIIQKTGLALAPLPLSSEPRRLASRGCALAAITSSQALLLSAGVEPRRQRGLPGLLGTHFGHELGPAELAVVARAATWRDLADYERTWQANAEVTTQAFAEIEPLMVRLQQLLAEP